MEKKWYLGLTVLILIVFFVFTGCLESNFGKTGDLARDNDQSDSANNESNFSQSIHQSDELMLSNTNIDKNHSLVTFIHSKYHSLLIGDSCHTEIISNDSDCISNSSLKDNSSSTPSRSAEEVDNESESSDKSTYSENDDSNGSIGSESDDSSKASNSLEDRLIGSWHNTLSFDEEKWVFYQNGSMMNFLEYSEEDDLFNSKAWYTYKVNDTSLCLSSLESSYETDKSFCFSYEFSSDFTTFTLSINGTEFMVFEKI